ncbi:MAG: hypothetical protein AAF628_35340 [Planctomycetota bacterium]
MVEAPGYGEIPVSIPDQAAFATEQPLGASYASSFTQHALPPSGPWQLLPSSPQERCEIPPGATAIFTAEDGASAPPARFIRRLTDFIGSAGEIVIPAGAIFGWTGSSAPTNYEQFDLSGAQGQATIASWSWYSPAH